MKWEDGEQVQIKKMAVVDRFKALSKHLPEETEKSNGLFFIILSIFELILVISECYCGAIVTFSLLSAYFILSILYSHVKLFSYLLIYF
jgi:hypothetical protein